MTLKEALHDISYTLERAGIDEPRLEAELILGQALGWNRAQLLAHLVDAIPQESTSVLSSYVQRRVRREPLAYITGYKEFYGLEFLVDSRVLVPRPETELLVEEALAFAQHLQNHRRSRIYIADVGTGSGILGVTLAHHLKNADIWCMDISPKALDVAAMNARRHEVIERVHLIRGDLLGPIGHPADLIVANLPYITDDDFHSLQPEISLFEPPLALQGGPGGTDIIERLLAQAGERLRRPGLLLMEIGADQAAQALAAAVESFPEARVSILKDLAGLDRILRAEL